MDEQGAAELGARPAEPEEQVVPDESAQVAIGNDGAVAGEADVPMNMLTGVQIGPDGQPWPWLQIEIGLTVFKLLVPEATARKLAKTMPGALLEACTIARRKKLGLEIASQMPPGSPFGGRANGRGHG
jgi:hypothetical protein